MRSIGRLSVEFSFGPGVEMEISDTTNNDVCECINYCFHFFFFLSCNMLMPVMYDLRLSLFEPPIRSNNIFLVTRNGVLTPF